MASIKYNNCYINDTYSIAGPMEKEGQIKSYDFTLNDYYFQEKTFEDAEIKMQKKSIDNILLKNKLNESNIDVVVGGDLFNQIAITSSTLENYNISFLGTYSACATFVESLIISANMINTKSIKKAIAITSSHNLTAEKQFRYPVEYGSPKHKCNTFTATGCVACLLSNVESKIKIESSTIGQVINMGIKDVNNMGAVMAPAAASTIVKHLEENKRDINYYDVILTGDLGIVGSKILKEFLNINYNIKLKNHLDAGTEIYTKSQDVNSGSSGPVSLPLVLFNKILKNKKYKKILIVGTGSLHTPTLVNQKNSIGAIAHAVSLEVI
jgi:stage V sporulation protein AD